MKYAKCPKCDSEKTIKSGFIKNKQRFLCKNCHYYFTVSKIGKRIDTYTVIKSLQLYLEGISYREIERLLGVSHVSVMNWVKKYHIKTPPNTAYRPTYKVLSHSDLMEYFSHKDFLKGAGLVLSELGDKYMMIKWERFQ